jgi:hypothetical protein
MEAKKETTYATGIAGMTRPAIVFDMAAFDVMMKVMPLREKKPEREPFQVFYQSSHFAMPVIRSQYLGGYQEDKPSIINDFDRWFVRAQSRAEQNVYMARVEREERSRRAIESCWRV